MIRHLGRTPGNLSAEQNSLLNSIRNDYTTGHTSSSNHDVINCILEENTRIESELATVRSKCAQLEEDLNVKEVMRIDEVEKLNEQINRQAATMIDETNLNEPNAQVMDEILNKSQALEMENSELKRRCRDYQAKIQRLESAQTSSTYNPYSQAEEIPTEVRTNEPRSLCSRLFCC